MFVNLTNHPHEKWSVEQISAASEYGEIKDISFPNVPPAATEAQVDGIAKDLFEQIIDLDPDVVMCQGEMTLTFRLVVMLKARGIKTVAACSERCVQEVNNEDGSTQQITRFVFRGFREY